MLLSLVSQMDELMTLKDTVRNIKTAVENWSTNYNTSILTVDSPTKDYCPEDQSIKCRM